MLAIFGAEGVEGRGIFAIPIVKLVIVLLAIYLFLKFCGWAKKFQVSAGVKKVINILTLVGIIGFNVFYSLGNKAIEAGAGWGCASIALVASLAWIFVFAFTLMAETKPQ